MCAGHVVVECRDRICELTMERIVFLERNTIQANSRRPNFDHEWIKFGETFPGHVVERLRGATIVISNKLPLREAGRYKLRLEAALVPPRPPHDPGSKRNIAVQVRRLTKQWDGRGGYDVAASLAAAACSTSSVV